MLRMRPRTSRPFNAFERLESRLLLTGQFFYVNDNWHKSSPGILQNGDLVDNANDDGSLQNLLFGTDAFASLDLALALAASTAVGGVGGDNTIVIVSGNYGTTSSATLTSAISLQGWSDFATRYALPSINPDPTHLNQSLLNPSLLTTLTATRFTFADATTGSSFVTGFKFAAYSATGAIILGTANQSTVTIAANTFTHSTAARAIVIDAGTALISANSISGAGLGILIRSGNASITSNHITLQTAGTNNTYGIAIAGGQTASITNNLIDHSSSLGLAAILVTDNGANFGGTNSSASALISANQISGAQFGIALDGQGTAPVSATISSNTISNTATAIYLQGLASADLTANRITTAGVGIHAFGGTALISANSITASATGILLENAATATLAANRFDTGTPNATDLEIADITSLTFAGGNHFAASNTFINNFSPLDFTLTHEQFATRDAQLLADKIYDQTDDEFVGLLTINLQLSFDSMTLSSSTLHAADILTLTGTYTDQGDDDPHQLHINWGDGSPVQTVPITGNTFAIPHLYTTAGTASISAYVTASDNATTAPRTATLTLLPGQVLTRQLFYKGSAFDAGSHDNAIAPDKSPLLPGQTASSANYSSYTQGINGLLIDLAGTVTGLSLADFQFTVGNDDFPDAWTTPIATPLLTLRPGEGLSNSTRAEITFPDLTIAGQWLRIKVLANLHTGLPADDIFYFGNAIAEAGNSPSDTKVNAADELSARFAATPTAPITHPFDYNRDGIVNNTDELAARQHNTWFQNELHLIHPPSSPSFASLTVALPPATTPPASLPLAGTLPMLSNTAWKLQFAASHPLLAFPSQTKKSPNLNKLGFRIQLHRP